MSKKNEARYEPGELDKVRKNIGELDREESQRMAAILGGEVGVEKSAPISEASMKTLNSKRRQYIPTKYASQEEKTRVVNEANNDNLFVDVQRKSIPTLSKEERRLFYRLLTSNEYGISKKSTFLKYILSLGNVSPDILSSYMLTKTLPTHIEKIESFIEAIRNLVDATSGEYKAKIINDDDPYFKTLRYIYEWKTHSLHQHIVNLQHIEDATIEDAIPFTRELFKMLIRFYWLGENKMTETIKKLYTAATNPNSTKKEANLSFARQAAAQWIYIYTRIIKGLYPLLMRTTIDHCELFSEFYTQHLSKILPFLEITKYDLILPQKNKTPASTPVQQQNQEEQTKAETPTKNNSSDENDEIPARVRQSLEVLNNLFPSAGWLDLEKKPDFFPYFHPLYQFKDGFNILSPSNPLQTTIVLLRIIEDFFQGCRNIAFNINPENPQHSEYIIVDDSLQKIISQWSQYREVLFNKILSTELRDYVNRIYAKNDFKNSKYGKKQLSNWLWQMKYFFHPHLTFEIVFLERPAQDSTYKPLAFRVTQLSRLFNLLIKNASSQEEEKMANFSAPYRFDVENPISYRLNILLGGQSSELKNNLNLLKYATHAIMVLDWWLNDKESLAYKETIRIPYRTENEDGEPSFSAPMRKNQKELFLHYAKKRNISPVEEDSAEREPTNDSPSN